jgi:hypothetical protein
VTTQATALRQRSIALFVMLLGCTAAPLSVERAAAETPPSPTAAATAPPSATINTQGAAPVRSTGACEDTLGDHIRFYGDADRPPPLAKQQVFLELCLALPPLFQLCASPGYQADHEAECRPVHAATGEERRLWSELFDAFREAP